MAANAPKRVLVPTRPVADAWRGGGAFDDSFWTPVTGGSGEIGYNLGARAGGRFSLDTRSRMYNEQTSCYVRVPFSFTGNRQNVVGLTLSIHYNDGFVAYLNGVEIARRNCTGTPAWNATATGRVDDPAGLFETIQVLNFSDLLRPDDNLLAVQGLTVSASSPDFLLSFELTADESAGLEMPGRAASYSTPLRLSQSTQVKARALVGGRWSALNEATFAVGPVAESLRISEIMYHPAEMGNRNDPNTEYLELVNIGSEAIHLSLVRFTDGIEFTFPSYLLPPAGYCLIVKDRAAFEARYDPGLPVAGQYAGSLSNSGERIVLQDAAGRVIHDFAYSDDWHSSTDGRGFSLTVTDPSTVAPNALGDPAAWRPSANPGGSPGSADPARF